MDSTWWTQLFPNAAGNDSLEPEPKRARRVAPPQPGQFPVAANLVGLPVPQGLAAATTNAAAPDNLMPRPLPEASPENYSFEAEKNTNRKRRNVEYSRKSRERKLIDEQSLQMELAELERENTRIKALIKRHLPEKSQEIIGECCYKQRGGRGLFDLTSSKLVRSDFDLIENLTKTRQSFILTDPRLADNPIVYASRAFLSLTGYTREQVIGRNCRFLQGIDTDPSAVAVIREAIESGTDGAICLLNYKADETPFWNQLFVAALRRDRENQIANFVRQHRPFGIMFQSPCLLLFVSGRSDK